MKLHKNLISRSLGVAILAMTGQVQADITIEQKFTMDGGGMMSLFATSGVVRTEIAGDRSRTDSQLQSQSRLMRQFGADTDTASITRLDRGVNWELIHTDRKYTEISFDTLRAQMAENLKMVQTQSGGAQGAIPINNDQCQWTRPNVNVDRTGNKERYAGIKAEQHIIQVSQACHIPEQNKTCEVIYTLESWLAKRMPKADEVQQFHGQLAKQLGTEELILGMQPMAQGMVGMFQEGWSDALDEMTRLKGYPLKTVMQLEMGGEQCTTESGQPIAMDSLWTQAANAGLDAAINSAAGHAGQAVAEKAADAVGDSVGEQVAGSALGAAAGTVVSGLFGKLRRKKDQKVQTTHTQPETDFVTIFRISQEVTKVSKDKIPATRFEVPAGWEKASS